MAYVNEFRKQKRDKRKHARVRKIMGHIGAPRGTPCLTRCLPGIAIYKVTPTCLYKVAISLRNYTGVILDIIDTCNDCMLLKSVTLHGTV